MVLEILKTTMLNDYNQSGICSSVTAAQYSVDGETKSAAADEGKLLVLAVDGAQKDLVAGKSYEGSDYEFISVKAPRVGGPSAAPWTNAAEEDKATYYFRQALYVDGQEIDEDASAQQLLKEGTHCRKHAENLDVKIDGGHFNGIFIDNGTEYKINDSKFTAKGNGADDLSGWAAVLMADNKSDLEVDNCYIETEGALRVALYVDNTAIAKIKNSVLYSQECGGSCEDFRSLVPAMMKRVPFALGMDGNVRTLNVMADGQGKFDNCVIVSTGWGAISTDSGTAYDICGTYALDVENTLSGIGYLEVAQPGKQYTATKEINGVTWGFTVNGSGYVTYADSGVHNRYKNCQFYSPDFIQIMGSGNTGSSYIGCYLYAEHTAFMTQQTGGGTFDFTDTTVDTVDAFFQIKSGAANTGFSNVIADNCKINFSGTSTRSGKDGILVELIESDDAGNPGILEATINDHPEEAVATNSSVNDATATFKNGDYTGNIYNSIYNYKQLLDVTFENASYKGTVSATTAIHVDLDGNVVPNGTVLHAFMGSEEYDHANYAAEKGGMSGDCKIIGRFKHTVNEMLNNPINVTLKGSKWNVTGSGYINALTADSISDITADAPVTVTVKALTIAGESYADGTYTEGNVTIVVDSTEIEVIDNGVADAGQTYGNVKYQFICKTEDGQFDSSAVTLKRQNYIDGNLYYKMFPAEGVEIISCEPVNSTVEVNTAGGELEMYESVLIPTGDTKEMSLIITIRK